MWDPVAGDVMGCCCCRYCWNHWGPHQKTTHKFADLSWRSSVFRFPKFQTFLNSENQDFHNFTKFGKQDLLNFTKRSCNCVEPIYTNLF